MEMVNGRTAILHGDTLKSAKEDLIYKISNRDKSEYDNLTIESELTFEDAIECYRVVTGSCGEGTKDFVKNCLTGETKKKYSIKEIIKLTDGRYGNETFKQFFNK